MDVFAAWIDGEEGDPLQPAEKARRSLEVVMALGWSEGVRAAAQELINDLGALVEAVMAAAGGIRTPRYADLMAEAWEARDSVVDTVDAYRISIAE